MQNEQVYEAVIGLEVHAQLLTATKLFCADALDSEAAPNTHVSVVSLAHPGTLPVLNKKVPELAIKLGLALGCEIAPVTYFSRKNYFYPDLPKGYQVSQDKAPICVGGSLTVSLDDGTKKMIQLNRIHMEEDAGKSLHDVDDDSTCLDYNRAGTPLLEIVTEPCLHSGDEAFAYLTALRKLVRWLGVCDGNMEAGSMRCDANISVRPIGDKNLYTRVEIKNLNSIRNVKRAIALEVDRLIDLTKRGVTIVQETRSYDADNNTSFSLRSKEDAHDYRYFPEPDLPAFTITETQLKSIKETMPELPGSVKTRLENDFGLSAYDAGAITADKETTDFYFDIIPHSKHYKTVANWVCGPLKNIATTSEITFADLPLSALQLAKLINYTLESNIHFNVASTRLLEYLFKNPDQDPKSAAESLQLIQSGDASEINSWIDEVLTKQADKIQEYKKGKKGLLGMFAGEVKKLSKGKADMVTVQKLLEEKLNS